MKDNSSQQAGERELLNNVFQMEIKPMVVVDGTRRREKSLLDPSPG